MGSEQSADAVINFAMMVVAGWEIFLIKQKEERRRGSFWGESTLRSPFYDQNWGAQILCRACPSFLQVTSHPLPGSNYTTHPQKQIVRNKQD